MRCEDPGRHSGSDSLAVRLGARKPSPLNAAAQDTGRQDANDKNQTARYWGARSHTSVLSADRNMCWSLSQQLTSLRALQPQIALRIPKSSTKRLISAVSGLAQGAPPAAFPAGGPWLCLERAVGERQGVDAALWESGHFHAQVYPDLPLSPAWHDLLQLGLGGQNSVPATPSSGGAVGASSSSSTRQWNVRTVAAQCRSRSELQRLMQQAAGEGGADALLLVSGSHPARQLPLAASLLPNSVALLQAGVRMREAGELPAALSLWAVENPAHPLESLELKAAAGAEVVLTQPPFLRERSQAWFEGALAAGLSTRVHILPGVPMASSLGNLDFWLRLAGLRDDPGAGQVLGSFPRKGPRESAEEHAAAVKDWNAAFIRDVSAPHCGAALGSVRTWSTRPFCRQR